MRVTAVRTALVTAPWTGDPSWVGGAAFERTAALVIVETDEGITGLGEPIMGYFHADVVPPLIDYSRATARSICGSIPPVPRRPSGSCTSARSGGAGPGLG